MHHACTVIPAGKAFVRQIITLVNIVHKGQQTFPLWPIMVEHICQTPALISGSHDKEVTVTSGASGSWGCGGGYGPMWFQLQWNGKSQHLVIAIIELIPVLIASFIWGHKWKGHNVLVYCDNEAVVFVLNKCYSRDPYLAHMLRTLFFVQIKAVHIPGSHNTLVDLLSRNQVTKFRTQQHNADIFPTRVPLSLLQWLLDKWTGHQNTGPNCSALLWAVHSLVNKENINLHYVGWENLFSF